MKIINAIRCWLLQLHIDSMKADVSAILHQRANDRVVETLLENRISHAKHRLAGLRRSS